jgi:hypothetical protein
MRFTAVLLLAIVAGCPDRTLSVDPPQSSVEVSKIIPTTDDIDVLFVIDDSPSTMDKQQVFASNFANFVAALDAFPDGRPNLHVGVISSSVDLGVAKGAGCPTPSPADGRLQSAPHVAGCTPPTGHWIEDVAAPGGGRTTNYAGPLDQELACIAELGTGGCGYEAPLQAIERAFDGTHPENDGFLRPGALLVVIVLTDEDDASVKDHAIFALPDDMYGASDFRAQPLFAYTCDQPISATAPGSYTNCRTRTDSYLETPEHYHDALAALKGPNQVVVAVIGGDPIANIQVGAINSPFVQSLALEPSCSSTIDGNFAIGRPAIRLDDFVSRFGEEGEFATVCQPDYSKVLTDIGAAMARAVSPCLSQQVDPSDCVVADVTQINTPSAQETEIPRCALSAPNTPAAGGARPCFWIETAAASCAPPSSGLALHVERTAPAPAGDDVEVRCIAR